MTPRRRSRIRVFFPALVVLAAVCPFARPIAKDREGAKEAYAQAAARDAALSQIPANQRRQAEYEAVIGLYRKVPLLDPAVGECDDALFRISSLRREGGKLFAQPRWVERALESLDWLLKEYPYSPLRREALRMKGDILAGDLGRPDEARAVYEEYLRRYPRHASTSEVSRKLNDLKGETVAAPREETSKYPRLMNIRYWSTTDYTRVILDFDGKVNFSHDAAYNPYRIFFDFDKSTLSPEVKEKIAPQDDIYLNGIRAAQFKKDVVRVVLDFKKSGSYTVFALPNTFSIVIDIRDPEQSAMVLERRKKLAQVFRGDEPPPSTIEERDLPPPPGSRRTTAGSPANPPETASTPGKAGAAPSQLPPSGGPGPVVAPPPPPAGTPTQGTGAPVAAVPPATPVTPGASPNRQGAPPSPDRTPPHRGDDRAETPPATLGPADVATLSRVMRLKIGRIVIDPGHGGKDCGSTGFGGILEKDMVLAIARELKKAIESTLSIEAVLTRDADVFIPLEQRTAKVNTEKADLFISLHANASDNRKVGGFETFYLGFSRDRKALMLAAYENAATEKNLGDLSDVIRKITQYEKMKESRIFANKIHRRLCGILGPLDPAARDRGIKTAPFVVLIGTNVPSVLVEIGFISNRKEAEFISDPANHAKIAAAVVEGIRDYLAGFEIRAHAPTP